jgi:hypothetical protein
MGHMPHRKWRRSDVRRNRDGCSGHPVSAARRRLWAIVLSALLNGAAFAAWSQPATLGASLEVSEWMKRTLDFQPERVVLVEPTRVVVLRSVTPEPPSNFKLIVHTENLGTFAQAPGSSEIEFFVNCPSRRFHVERIETFTENGGRGVQSTSYGENGWFKALSGSTDDRVLSSVCGAETPQAPEPRPPPRPAPVAAPKPAPAPRPPPPAVAPIVAPVVVSGVMAPPQAPSGPAGSVTVQLFAAAARPVAERFAKGLPDRLPGSERHGAVEIREGASGDHKVFRVLVGGFASAADATNFCVSLKNAKLDCFIRRGGD